MVSIQTKWRNHIQEHKSMFVLLAIGLFLIELEIFAMAALKSGRETTLTILDQQDHVVYTARGNHLDSQSKAEFEATFGPLANYRVNLVTTDRPFPFRAWFAAAAGLPMGAVLLFGFFVRTYEALFIRPKNVSVETAQNNPEPTGRLDRFLAHVSRLNIFIIGALVFLTAIGLWAVPHLLGEFSRSSIAVISRYKWIAIVLAAVFIGLVVWIIYLRYLLARKVIESQTEVEKFRLQLEMSGNPQGPFRLQAPSTHRLNAPQQMMGTPPQKTTGELSGKDVI